MKKLIAILVVFALVMGAAFAEASVSGAVNGSVVLFGSDTSKGTDNRIYGDGAMNRIRIEVSGANDEGTFGAWTRFDGAGVDGFGYVWWKPIDQFLMRIGSNGYDGFNGKDGVTRWMFYQTPTDVDVTFGGANAWAGSIYNEGFDLGLSEEEMEMLEAFGIVIPSLGFDFGSIFFGGYGGTNALMLEIKPVEMFGINIALPYFNDYSGRSDKAGEIAYIFKDVVLQFDVNLDFGNIALTFTGDASTDTFGKVYLYAGIPISDTFALDVGFSMALEEDAKDQPINFGVGVKVGITEEFGLKARVGAKIPMGDDKTTIVLADVLPYFALSDLMTVFVSVGLGVILNDGDTAIGWHFNPYLQVGEEWGPKFLAGIKLWQGYADGGDRLAGGDSYVNWAVPIALMCSF